MRFWNSFTSGVWLAALTVTLQPSPGFAGPLFPNVRASQSTNGKWLAVSQQTFGKPDHNGVRDVLRTTYTVLRSEPFVNFRDRLQTQAPFWSEGWHLTLSQGLFLPLISNDGQTLVLVAAGAAWKSGDQEVLRIYKQGFNTAKLVRAVRLSNVWTKEEIESHAIVSDMGDTPMWYAGGSLEFSADGRELFYRSRWNHRVTIELADGSTSLDRK